MRVQLPTLVTSRDVHQRQITDTRDLHKVGCLHEMRAGDGPGGNETSAVAGFETPRDFDALGVPYRRVRSGGRGRVQAEVVDGVDCGRESQRLYLNGGRTEDKQNSL